MPWLQINNTGSLELTREIKQNQQSPKIVSKTAKQLLEEKENSAGFSNKPAAEFGARTATQNHTQGGDILQDV